MEYGVEELAKTAGIGVDTVRFYQARGLLPSPRRAGRKAVYSEEHLQRLRQIRHHQSQGLPLAVIKRVLAAGPRSADDALLTAVADTGGERTLTRAEVADRSGLPEPLLAAAESAGFLQPVTTDGEPRYGEADVQMARAGLEILRHGFPIDELLGLAAAHHGNVEQLADQMIELFDRFVRSRARTGGGGDAVAEAFRSILPAATTLVAQHFQRTILNRALDRLRERGEGAALDAARAVVAAGRLEVTWK